MRLINLPIHKRLKALKVPIKKWNKEVFGNVESKLNEAEQEVLQIVKIDDEKILTQAELNRRELMVEECVTWRTRKCCIPR